MRTFHQDKSDRLKANLKTAAKNTMRTIINAGKSLSGHISKKAVVFAAVAAISMTGSNAQAKGLLDKVLGVMEKVENIAYKVEEPFYKFNRQYDRTKRAVDDARWQVSETDRRLGGAISTGANIVQGVIDKKVSGRILDDMEQGQSGAVPLVAEDGQVQMVSPQNNGRRQSSANLNVVGEISLDELAARNNKRISSASVPSEAGSVQNVSGEITLDQLASYTQARSASRTSSANAARAHQAQESTVKKTSQTGKQTRKLSTEELLAQMVQQGYVK